MYRFNKKKPPLYAVIRDEILAKIIRGDWPIDQQLPTEDELRTQYNTSRGTVRQAMAELETEGYIERMAGKGTFVTRVTPKLEKSLEKIQPFTQQLVQAGFEPTTEVLFAAVIQVAEAVGSRVIEGFGLPDDAEVIHIQRVRKGNGIPFAIQSVYLQPELCPGILAEDLTQLMKLYESKYNRTLVEADEALRVASASEEVAKLLAVELGTLVVIRDRISYDQEGEVFEVLHSIDCSDRFKYRYRIMNDLTNVPPIGDKRSEEDG